MAIQSSNPPEIHSFGPWLGLNQQSPQGSIGDDEEFWNENFFAIGPGNLRTCWGHGPVIYTAPSGTQILRIFFGTYGNQTAQFSAPPPGQFGWMFLSNGRIDEVDLATGAVNHVGGGIQVWEPISPQFWASAKVWRPQFFGNATGQQGGVLFGSPAGLFAWDGTTLSAPGAPAPDWLTNAQETGSPPVPFTMPQGLPGIYAMEVYESRLWVAGKDVISFSAASNGADFSTTDGGGSFGYFGDKLVYSYMDLAASAGYLFIFGDSSIDMIGNVTTTTTGSAPATVITTNFTLQNIDPQVGQRFPRPVGRINRFFEMWNGAGIFECRGGDTAQIGQKVTNIFNTLIFPKTAADANGTPPLYYPTMATATMFGFKVLLCNGRFTDPFGITRNLLLMWHPEQTNFWSVASQGLELTNIGHYEQDSIITPYGTDGTSLYQLFANPSNDLPKRLVTKGLRGDKLAQITIKNWKRLFLEYQDNTTTDGFYVQPNGQAMPQGVNITGIFATYGGGIPNGRQDIGFEMAPGETFLIQPYTIQGQGITGAVDISSISPDFTIERLHVVTEERTLWGA